MARITEITSMCKEGKLAEAYAAACQDMNTMPDNIWSQRAMFWALYYSAKADIAGNNLQNALSRLDEILNLSLIRTESDQIILNSLLRLLSDMVKYCPADRFDIMDKIFAFVQHYTFEPSKEYSFFLKECCKMTGWDNLVAFVEWWQIDNLLPEDYQKYRTDKGREIISTAESVAIAYSKALLKLNDKQKIKDFVPFLEGLLQEHKDMMYPGYYCAKLMLALSADKEQMLDRLSDFIRAKRSEFWLWQFVSEMYSDDELMWLACLLRASHCKAAEKFLGKVRLELANYYITKQDFPRAKYQLAKIVECRRAEGWSLSAEVINYVMSSWYGACEADSSDPIDYRVPTNNILYIGANESIAVVTNVDCNTKRAYIVYAKEKTTAVKFKEVGFAPKQGDLLKLKWVENGGKGIKVLAAEKVDVASFESVSYIKKINGKVLRGEGQNFAFVRAEGGNCYVAPDNVKKYSLENKEQVSAVAALTYNKKKDAWNWMCIKIEK